MATNKMQHKFCVIKVDDGDGNPQPSDTRNGLVGYQYAVSAEWSYYGDGDFSIMDWTPDWLYKTLSTYCPHRQEEVESIFWIPDSEIAALKAKADFVADVRVTRNESYWNTGGWEEREQEKIRQNEFNTKQSNAEKFLQTIPVDSKVILCTAITCNGPCFAVGTFKGTCTRSLEITPSDPAQYTHVILEDPIEVEFDSLDNKLPLNITVKSGQHPYADSSLGANVNNSIFTGLPPTLSTEDIVEQYLSNIRFVQNVININ